MSALYPEDQVKVLARITRMKNAAEGDFSTFLNVSKPLSYAWVEPADKYYDRDVIQKIINQSDPTDFSNDYLVTCCEFGALLATVLQEKSPQLEWIPDWPYWESSLFDPNSGTIIPPFHWAIKKMSEYGVDDVFSEKIIAVIEVMKDEAKK